MRTAERGGWDVSFLEPDRAGIQEFPDTDQVMRTAVPMVEDEEYGYSVNDSISGNGTAEYLVKWKIGLYGSTGLGNPLSTSIPTEHTRSQSNTGERT